MTNTHSIQDEADDTLRVESCRLSTKLRHFARHSDSLACEVVEILGIDAWGGYAFGHGLRFKAFASQQVCYMIEATSLKTVCPLGWYICNGWKNQTVPIKDFGVVKVLKPNAERVIDLLRAAT